MVAPPTPEAALIAALRARVAALEEMIETEAELVSLEVAKRDALITQLKKSEDRYHTMFTAGPVPMWLWESATERVVEVNDAAVRLLAFSREELLAMRQSDFCPFGARVGDGELVKVVRKDAVVRDVELYQRQVDLDGVPVLLTSVLDVTDKLRLEARLRQTQKMEAIGRLAGGIAHDFNNIVSTILMSAELAASNLEGHPALPEVREIELAAGRAAALTRQVLAFSRQQGVQLRNVSLNEVVEEVATMLRRLLGDNVRVALLLMPQLPVLRADRTQLQQVVMNLALNARDAMPSGGDLTIRTDCVEIDPSQGSVLGVASGRYARLSVADTGCGMDAETSAQIFEPFFTTKEVGKGTGLGLAVVFGVVEELHGRIMVTSEVGRGTTFELYFPVP